MTAPPRIPFPVVDEVSRHCLQEAEPETVHIEVHLPGRLEPARLRKAFTEALRRHPRILVREAPGPWYRRRYAWEPTDGPDAEPGELPGARGQHALRDARTRALRAAPPLTASPPVRLEEPCAGRREGTVLVLTVNHTAMDGPSCLRVLATAAELYGGRDNEPGRPARPSARRAARPAGHPVPRGRGPPGWHAARPDRRPATG
ncbi:hypothetical protein GCM10019016_040350 [Streptomyces prasinosporus]|uniref:Condensation protein n=1 Tax=Streptomyces prasinosporus TaxID=68256 RepID=A0ABP6TNS8_9ACTN